MCCGSQERWKEEKWEIKWQKISTPFEFIHSRKYTRHQRMPKQQMKWETTVTSSLEKELELKKTQCSEMRNEEEKFPCILMSKNKNWELVDGGKSEGPLNCNPFSSWFASVSLYKCWKIYIRAKSRVWDMQRKITINSDQFIQEWGKTFVRLDDNMCILLMFENSYISKEHQSTMLLSECIVYFSSVWDTRMISTSNRVDVSFIAFPPHPPLVFFSCFVIIFIPHPPHTHASHQDRVKNHHPVLGVFVFLHIYSLFHSQHAS